MVTLPRANHFSTLARRNRLLFGDNLQGRSDAKLFPEATAQVELTFGKNLETNGSISAITIAQVKAK